MSDGSPERGQKRNDNLESKQINVQYKRYYVDVNENARGRFIKIAELGSNYKGRIMLTIPAAFIIRDQMSAMIEVMEMKESSSPTGKETVLVKSESLSIDGRRFYIDLKENERGRFLRIAQMPQNPRQERQQIAIPSAGVTEIRDALSDFLAKYSEGYNTVEQDSKAKLTTENKTFLFNVGENDRGQFMRISEVKLNSGFRNAITIPMPSIEEFKKCLAEASLPPK